MPPTLFFGEVSHIGFLLGLQRVLHLIFTFKKWSRRFKIVGESQRVPQHDHNSDTWAFFFIFFVQLQCYATSGAFIGSGFSRF